MAELISIIVTTYNREDALNAVLRSLGQQQDGDFEVIVYERKLAPAAAENRTRARQGLSTLQDALSTAIAAS